MFDKKVFNEKQYSIYLRRYSVMVEEFIKQVEVLRNEGFTADVEFIATVTASDEAYKEYIQELSDEQTKGKFLDKTMKKQIEESFLDLYDRTRGAVSQINHYLSEGLPVIADGDSVKVDSEAIEKNAKETATHAIDTKGMEAYWEKVEQLTRAFDDLREYEVKNGLPDFVNGKLQRDMGDRLHFIDYDYFIKKGGSKEYFQEISLDYFKKN